MAGFLRRFFPEKPTIGELSDGAPPEASWKAPDDTLPDSTDERIPVPEYTAEQLIELQEKLEAAGVDMYDVVQALKNGSSLMVDNPDVLTFFEMYSKLNKKPPVARVILNGKFSLKEVLPQIYEQIRKEGMQSATDGSLDDFSEATDGQKFNYAISLEPPFPPENTELPRFVGSIRSNIQYNGMQAVIYNPDPNYEYGYTNVNSELGRNTLNIKSRKN